MALIRGLCMAFSLYSKIPMPMVKWEEKNMKYVFCFFPLIGVVIGALLIGENHVFELVMNIEETELTESVYISLAHLCKVFLGIAIPVFVTGGIHLDGFLDTCDALHSYGDRRKKLDILKDPHIGAFAIICAFGFFFLVIAGAVLIIKPVQVYLLASGFIASRILSGLALVSFPSAKKEGMLYTFAFASSTKVVRAVLSLWYIAVLVIVWLQISIFGVIPHAIGLLVWFYYLHMAKTEFGGLTGDLAGWFLTVYEGIFVWTAMFVGFFF